MRRALLAFLLLLSLHAARGEPLWQTLPPTPAPVPGEYTGHAKVNGISLYYATIGHGSPVVLLHGGLANSDYWGNQIKALAPRHTVIVVESRGHGRSTRDARPYGYDLMVDDVVALLDTLHIAKADVVGWSDGGILGLPHEGDAVPAANRLHATAPSPDGQVRGLALAANVNRRRPSSHAGPALALAPLLP